MSVEYCQIANQYYDTDFEECCSSCEFYKNCINYNYE